MNAQVKALARREIEAKIKSEELVPWLAFWLVNLLAGIVSGIGAIIPWDVRGPVVLAYFTLIVLYVVVAVCLSAAWGGAFERVCVTFKARRNAKQEIVAWLEKIEPNITGPELPESCWNIWWPVRTERTEEIDFGLEHQRYNKGTWCYIDRQPFLRSEQIADTSALAGAWAEVCLEAQARNKRAWQDALERQEKIGLQALEAKINKINKQSIFRDAKEIMRGA